MDVQETIFTWDLGLLPLKVLYSPNLRLRYRVGWEKAVSEVGRGVERVLFQPAAEAEKHVAYGIECRDEAIPAGVVYVCDCRKKFDVDGETVFTCNSKNAIAARVFLPRAEESPYDTIRATLHQIGHCLGLPDSRDPMSIMWPRVHDRPSSLSEDDILLLKNLYK